MFSLQNFLHFQLAAEYNIKFMETSAKTAQNVEESFITLARDIKRKMDRKLVCFLCQTLYLFIESK